VRCTGISMKAWSYHVLSFADTWLCSVVCSPSCLEGSDTIQRCAAGGLLICGLDPQQFKGWRRSSRCRLWDDIKLPLKICCIFNALHGMPARSSYEKAACPSVRPSNALIVTRRKKDLSRVLHHTKDL